MKQANSGNKEDYKRMLVFMTSFASEMGAIKDLLILLGKKEKTIEIEREYQIRKFFGPWGLKELGELYRENSIDRLHDATLYYCRRKLLKGMKEFVSELKERGFLVGALSSDPQFMMNVVKENTGLDFSYGMELEFERKIATGSIIKEFNRYDKAKLLKEKRKEFDIPKKNVITVGRASIIHLPAARESNIFIGFNPARENISNIARMTETKKSLKEIFSEKKS